MKTSPFSLFQWALAAATFAALGVPAATAQQVDIKSYGARCDGSDDSAAVQAAINAVSSGTVVISCSAGIGSNGIVLQNKSNVTVMGNGGNAGFRALAPTGQGVGNFGPVMFAVRNCTSCVIKDLLIDAQNVAVDSIGFDNNTNSTLQNVQVYNTAYPANAAIVATNGHGNKYLNNTVKTCQWVQTDGTRGMWIGNQGYAEYSPTISNNTVSDTGWTGIATHVVNATITNNLVYNTHGAGIKVVPPAGAGGATTVSGNTLRGNQFHGVQVDGADSAVNILSNTIDANQIAGVYTMGGSYVGKISGNTITNHPQAAIYMYNGQGVSIDNNTMTGNGMGLLIEADGGATLQNLQITTNTISGQSEHGISFWMRGGAVQGASITGNSISNNSLYGLFMESGNMTGISASSNCYSANGSGTIYDGNGVLTPVASSASCSPAGGTTKDTTAPTVQITAPTNGATVSGTVTLTAAASDNVGVTGVQFLLNGAVFGAKLAAAPYTAQWDTKTVGNGTYQWNAVATDAAGNSTTSSTVFVMVSNADTTPPTVQITSPANGSTVSGTVSVTSSASDNVGVAAVQYSLDGALLGAEVTVSPYALSWNTTGLAAGSHTLTATARDAAGNKSTSSVTVKTADTTAPTVKITAPTAGQSVSGTISLTASASDNVGVVGVQFLVDGAAYGTESTSGYSVSCNTAALANGSHTVSAVARDAAGNKATAAAVTMTVSNSTSGSGSGSGTTTTAVVRVNAGGPQYTDPSGNVWSADTGYNGGYAYAPGNTVSGTTNPVVYQTQRWTYGPLVYTFPVANGTYTINLKFAELYMSGSGQRVFDIAVNGATVQSSFDIFAAAGGMNKAIDKSYTVNVTGGSIAITLTPRVENPTVSAIEVLKSTTTTKTAVRVNAGGPQYTDPAGNQWAADNGYNGGYAYAPGNTVSGTSNPVVYQTQRWTYGPLVYTLQVPNGTYTVNLKFAELYMSGSGQRVFDIAINGATVQSSFDIFAAAGGKNKAVDKSYTVNVTGGSVTITLTPRVENPTVSAIEIVN